MRKQSTSSAPKKDSRITAAETKEEAFTFFGMGFNTTLKIAAFFLFSSVGALLYLSDNWEMTKLIMQQAGLSVFMIFGMIWLHRSQ